MKLAVILMLVEGIIIASIGLTAAMSSARDHAKRAAAKQDRP